MKILQVISSLNPAGGGPIEQVKQMSLAMQEMGHDVKILTLDNPGSAWLGEMSLEYFALGPSVLSYRYSPRLVPWLRQHASQFDAVIVRGIWQYSSFGVWRVFHKTKIPYFVFTHGMLDPWFKHAYPLKHLKKWLYWPWAEYRVLRDARAVLFTSEQERLQARKSFCLYKCNEIVVPYGTSEPKGSPEAQRETFFVKFPELRQKRIILFLGRIHPKKGCDLLIKIFSKIAVKENAVYLVMAGPDQVGWRLKLQKETERLKISKRVRWTGMLSGDLKWGAYNAAEVFVLPSHQENFGVAVAEAMACGVPVLISNKVNIWREIESDGAGLIANDDLIGVSELLEKWLALPYNRRQEMKQKARQCFTKRFEIHAATKSLVNVLEQNKA